MPLQLEWMALENSYHSYHIEFDVFLKTRPANSIIFSLTDEFFLEGLLSRIWQAWATFCRGTIYQSCLGTVAASGSAIPAHPLALSEEHVSSAAIKAKATNANPWVPASLNSVLRFEPTWGDTDMLVSRIPRLNPSNAAQLVAGYSGAHRAAKFLQTVRNACAHDNSQTRAELLLLRPRYDIFPISHPSQALLWVEPISGEYAILQALDELLENGLNAIQ